MQGGGFSAWRSEAEFRQVRDRAGAARRRLSEQKQRESGQGEQGEERLLDGWGRPGDARPNPLE